MCVYIHVCVCVHVNVCGIHAHTCAWKQRPEVSLRYPSTGAIHLGLGFGFVPFCYVSVFIFCSEAGCVIRTWSLSSGQADRALSLSNPLSVSPAFGQQARTIMSDFLCRFWELDLRLNTSIQAANTSWTKSSLSHMHQDRAHVLGKS